MKYKVTKTISLIMVLILLISALSACGDQNSKTLSEKKKQEINAAWMEKENEKLVWCDLDEVQYYGVRYYGDFNGYTIIFKYYTSTLTSDGLRVIAGYEFRHPQQFQIYAYKDGEFHTLGDAYQNGWLTDGQIEEIYNVHWYEYEKEINPSFYANYESLKGVKEPASYVPPVPTELLQAVEDKWFEEFGYEIKWRDIEKRHYDGAGFYGFIGQCFVIFIETNTIQDANNILTIGEYKFSNPNNFVIFLYKDGEFHTLQEGYEKGWLKDSELKLIWESHKSAVQIIYPEFYKSSYSN